MDQELVRQLHEFCAPHCDRFSFLESYLLNQGIPFKVSTLTDSKFFIINFDSTQTPPKNYYMKVLIAHYDRKENTPGANDNSAAVFQLLWLAGFLKTRNIEHHNIQIILSDHEEARGGWNIKEQGTYKLGMALQQLKVSNCMFFNFDMCGVGDTLILSEASEQLLESRRKTHTEVYAKLQLLRKYTTDMLETLKGGHSFSLRTPFSDNLGLVLQGYPAMQICVLPYHEAVRYRTGLENLKRGAQTLRGRLGDSQVHSIRQKYATIQPLTWRLRHTPYDTVDKLSPEAFKLMRILLRKLVYLRIPQ
jgi:hypothetical protein